MSPTLSPVETSCGRVSSRLQEALRLRAEGARVTILKPRSKAPLLIDWPNRDLTDAELEKYLGNDQEYNLGQLTEREVDVDHDCPEAIAIAPFVLPPTRRRHGRPSAGNSHWWYRPDRLPKHLAIDDPDMPGHDARIIELRGSGHQSMVPPSIHPLGEQLVWEEREEPAAVRGSELETRVRFVGGLVLVARSWPAVGGRHDASVALAGVLARRPAFAHKAAEILRTVACLAGDEEWQSRGQDAETTRRRLESGQTATGLPSLLDALSASPKRREAIADLLHMDNEGPPITGAAAPTAKEEERSWPALDEVALYGLAGAVVRAIDPHTEADRVAVLTDFLACFGNAVGHAPHAKAEESRHTTNLFIVHVGDTSHGRKGSAFTRASLPVKLIDEGWGKARIKSGLSSGEGLLEAVRDPSEKRDKDGTPLDTGVEDKRLLAIEEEYASVLKRMTGEGNTLSAILRQAWDHGNIATLTRHSPLCATGAHISIVGHVTRAELLRYLTETESASGFANRFLWFCVKRSKCLPDGGGTPNLQTITPRLRTAWEFAQTCRDPILRDEEARKLWHEKYAVLTADRPGLLGAITARAAPQTLRLSVLYALLDCSPVVRREHLQAALALWDYAKASAAYIFGDKLGDSVADRILEELRSSAASVLDRTEISRLFGRHVSAGRLDAALQELERQALVVHRIEETGGRPKTVFSLSSHISQPQNSEIKALPTNDRRELSEKSELSPVALTEAEQDARDLAELDAQAQIDS